MAETGRPISGSYLSKIFLSVIPSALNAGTPPWIPRSHIPSLQSDQMITDNITEESVREDQSSAGVSCVYITGNLAEPLWTSQAAADCCWIHITSSSRLFLDSPDGWLRSRRTSVSAASYLSMQQHPTQQSAIFTPHQSREVRLTDSPCVPPCFRHRHTKHSVGQNPNRRTDRLCGFRPTRACRACPSHRAAQSSAGCALSATR